MISRQYSLRMNQDTILPGELLDGIKSRKIPGLLDVRSEGEFKDGYLPQSVNHPILNNEERHLVGAEYKQKGQAAAIDLGVRLTAPFRTERTQTWNDLLRAEKIGALTCWRGGLRSKISQEWMRGNGVHLPRIEGGYKAIRNLLLRTLEAPPAFIVIGGWTGSGKTKLIEKVKSPKIDLEGMAVHRGSCFGEKLSPNGKIEVQPSQATFENQIAITLWGEVGPFVVEDESTRIGSLNVPLTIKEKMKISSVVFVEEDERTRAENIFEEYIHQPQLSGVPNPTVADFFLERLKFLKRHLGCLEHDRLANDIRLAFANNERDDHLKWIRTLLLGHYDKSYRFAFERLNRKIIFQGNHQACLEYLDNRSKS